MSILPIDTTSAKLNTPQNISVEKNKRATLYNVSIVSGTAIAGGGIAAWVAIHNFKKSKKLKFRAFAKEQIINFRKEWLSSEKTIKLQNELKNIPVKDRRQSLTYKELRNNYKLGRSNMKIALINKSVKEITSIVTSKTWWGVLIGAAVGAAIVGIEHYLNKKEENK